MFSHKETHRETHRETMGKMNEVNVQGSVQVSVRAPKMLRRAFIVSLGLMLMAPLAGCGRKAPPEHPKDSKFPRDYPSE